MPSSNRCRHSKNSLAIAEYTETKNFVTHIPTPDLQHTLKPSHSITYSLCQDQFRMFLLAQFNFVKLYMLLIVLTITSNDQINNLIPNALSNFPRPHMTRTSPKFGLGSKFSNYYSKIFWPDFLTH